MLTLDQEKVIDTLYKRIIKKEPVSTLVGIAGSGKTTAIRTLEQSLNRNVVYVAFTGAAAKNISENASTIHRLIYKPIFLRGKCIGFRKKSREELEGIDLIVADEYSMISQEILEDLMYYQIPLLLVGDKYQLKPIGQPNQFINIIHSELTEPLRQSLEDPIYWIANEVRKGNQFSNGFYGDTVAVVRHSEINPDWYRKDVRFLCGRNNTRQEINRKIAGEASFNSPVNGDRIIFLKNDYNAGIMNSTQADIISAKKIYGSQYLLSVEFDGEVIDEYRADYRTQKLPKNQFFDLAYATTVHKSQGQTIDHSGVIIDESFCFPDQRSNHLYTAITRFKTGNKLVIVR